MENIINILKFISEKSAFTSELMNNNEFLINEANKLDKNIIQEIYNNKKNINEGVIVKFRKDFINLITEKQITLSDFEIFYQNSVKENPKSFNSWKNYYKILHPLFIESFKNELEYNINELKNYMYKLFNLNEDNIKINISDFKGTQNFGDDKVWLALYNSTQPSQSTSNQFFFEIYKDKITYGFYRYSNKKNKYITEKTFQKVDEFDGNKLLLYFKQNQELILNDIYTNDFFSFKDNFKNNDLNSYFTLLQELIKSKNIQVNDERVSFFFGEENNKKYLCFNIRKKAFLSLKENGEFSVISNNIFSENNLKLESKKTSSYTNSTFDFNSILLNKENILEQFSVEYDLNEKSNRRNKNDEDFEEYVFSLINNSERKYYKFAPGVNAKYWDEFYNNGIVAVGYNELDVQNLNEVASYEELQQKYPNQKNSNQLWNIWLLKDAKINDVVFANKGRNKVLGIGVFEKGEYFYNTDHEYHHQRKINWITNKELEFSNLNESKSLFRADTFSTTLKYIIIINKYLEVYPELKDIFHKYGLFETQNISNSPMKTPKQNYPLNQILYGPPGTGKTYNTIMLAAQILKNGEEEVKEYEKALEIYNQALGSQIEFVTFHQNFSYEDFIQGLRPETKAEGMKFKKNDGVFTRSVINASFEFYLKENSKKVNKKDVDLNEVYLAFIKYLKIGEKYKSKSDAVVELVEINDNNNLVFKHTNGFREYIISPTRLLKLYNTYPKIDQIKNVHNDIRDAIGGINTTLAWIVLNEFINFKNNHYSEEAETIDEIEYKYDDKKELLKTLEINEKIDKDSLKPYIIIIDEINRANISRVFGELITLIEEDKRWDGDPKKVKWEVTLPSGDKFKIPNNLYIIGTMNTADKSIALLDVALRRRFVFNAYYPLYEIEENKYKYADDLKKLNDLIVGKLGKGRGHDLQIGHSYFMNLNTDKEFEESINNKVIPLLLEYFMNNVDDVETLIKDFLKGSNFELIVGSYPLKIKVAE